jgi:hypothetical protein
MVHPKIFRDRLAINLLGFDQELASFRLDSRGELPFSLQLLQDSGSGRADPSSAVIHFIREGE